jgi:hypothetical protein
MSVAAVLTGSVLSMLGCTTVGTGRGMIAGDDVPVAFAWTSQDAGISGIMSATIEASRQSSVVGGTFSGPFLQVTSDVRTDSFEPMWNGWRRGWNDWGYWGTLPESAFATHYSGKVIANLQGPGAQRLRCRFLLNAPAAGMGGGGQGECQFTGGRTVDAIFPHS